MAARHSTARARRGVKAQDMTPEALAHAAVAKAVHEVGPDAKVRVARERFVPVEHAGRVTEDEPIPIGHEQVTTHPSLVARMVEARELRGDERVLEVGTGLGWCSSDDRAALSVLAPEIFSVVKTLGAQR